MFFRVFIKTLIMEPKKSNKVNLENKKFIFLQAGLIIALAVILVSFEWKTYDIKHNIKIQRFSKAVIQEEIIQTRQEITPPQPPPPQISIINTVDNNVNIDKELEINIEATIDTKVEKYIPPSFEDETIIEPEIFCPIESDPQFPGGMESLRNYLRENIHYPKMAQGANIQGKVYVSFTVEKDGSISNIKILKGIGGGCDEEAVRLVKNMPDWIPGKQRHKAVSVKFTLPIKFTLN